jgi:histidine triad (HIT) family protein
LANSPGCVFCQIVSGEIPAEIVLEDGFSLAFLDHRPLFPGHCLLIPKDHIETLPHLPPHLMAPLLTNASLLAQAMEEALQAEGSFVAINNRVSQSVPHLHVHVVPRRKKDGLRGFFWPRQRYQDDADLHRVGDLLRASVARLKRAL